MHRRLASHADKVDLVLAGVIARPLYKCTEVVDADSGEVCMNVASMSRFLQTSNARSAYQCSDCIKRLQGAGVSPGSASDVLRGLWAYPLVEGVDGQPTPLRVPSPVRLLVHPPPDTWGWRLPRPPRPTLAVAAEPTMAGAPEQRWYKYTATESDAIWLASDPYKATLPLLE